MSYHVGRISENMGMDLGKLRQHLDGLDDELLRLVAKRQEIVAAIGEVKRCAGRSIRDFRRERAVLDRGRRIARHHALDPALAESVLQLLIASSLTRQEHERVTRTAPGQGRRALVIGAGGNMGGWFVRFLAAQGYRVEGTDPRETASPDMDWVANWETSPLEQDLILVAVPLADMGVILRRLSERHPRGVVVEIASIKAPLRSDLKILQNAGLRVASLHPMFGPDVELLAGRHVLSLDFPGAESDTVANTLFGDTMAEVVTLPLAEHDRLMAYVLGLSHALNLVFATTLARSGAHAELLARLSSTTFDAQLDVTAAVVAENPHLYFEIQHSNPEGEGMWQALSATIGDLHHTVEKADEVAFTRFMQEGLAYFDQRRRYHPSIPAEQQETT